MARSKVDRTDFDRLIDNLEDMPYDLVSDAYEFFKDKTPIDKGNARRNTKVKGNVILADYAYADRLDNGYSKQAPRGMSEPTLDYFRKLVDEKTRRL